MVIINVIVINGKYHKAIIIIVTVKTNTYLHVIYSL